VVVGELRGESVGEEYCIRRLACGCGEREARGARRGTRCAAAGIGESVRAFWRVEVGVWCE
jgi:hypothetical protein